MIQCVGDEGLGEGSTVLGHGELWELCGRCLCNTLMFQVPGQQQRGGPRHHEDQALSLCKCHC